MIGYMHPGYAESLGEFGTPRRLTECGGWILERTIPGFKDRDGMGCYPLFVCRDWSRLHLDLKRLENDLVCLSLVADPFGSYDEGLLRACFDTAMPFKQHFLADLGRPSDAMVCAHHRKYARRALRSISVDICEEPVRFLDEWTQLYHTSIQRFDVKGIAAFSRAAFQKQLTIPGAIMLRALYEGTAVGAHLVYLQDDICYGHLTGTTAAGQELFASYALYWTDVEYFSGKAHWMDWGAGAGVKNDDNSGLVQFKRGWSTDTRTSYFCTRIFDHERYNEIATALGISETEYFPAYRKGEFG